MRKLVITRTPDPTRPTRWGPDLHDPRGGVLTLHDPRGGILTLHDPRGGVLTYTTHEAGS